MHFLFPTFGTSFHEHRLMYFAGGISNIPKPGEGPLDKTSYLTWRHDTPGAKELLDAFDTRTNVTLEELLKYAEGLHQQSLKKSKPPKKPLTTFEQELIHNALLVKPDNTNKSSRLLAEATLRDIVIFINKRNEFLEEAQESRVRLNESQVLPGFTGTVLDTGKQVIGTTFGAFKAGSGKEKMVMLAGLATGILAVRYIASLFPKGGKFIKNSVGFVVGASVTYMAMETFNRTAKEVTGHTLLEMPFALADSFKTPEEQQKIKQKKELDKVYAEVAGKRISKEFIDGLDVSEEGKHEIIGIDAISDLTVEQFLKLYETSKVHESIPDNDPIYGLNFDEDFLTPIQRFILVREMGEALNFICPDNGKIINRPKKQLQLQQPLMRRIIDMTDPREGGDAEEQTGDQGGGADEQAGNAGGDANEQAGNAGGDANEQVGNQGGDVDEQVGNRGDDADEQVGNQGGDVDEQKGDPGEDANER